MRKAAYIFLLIALVVTACSTPATRRNNPDYHRPGSAEPWKSDMYMPNKTLRMFVVTDAVIEGKILRISWQIYAKAAYAEIKSRKYTYKHKSPGAWIPVDTWKTRSITQRAWPKEIWLSLNDSIKLLKEKGKRTSKVEPTQGGPYFSVNGDNDYSLRKTVDENIKYIGDRNGWSVYTGPPLSIGLKNIEGDLFFDVTFHEYYTNWSPMYKENDYHYDKDPDNMYVMWPRQITREQVKPYIFQLNK